MLFKKYEHFFITTSAETSLAWSIRETLHNYCISKSKRKNPFYNVYLKDLTIEITDKPISEPLFIKSVPRGFNERLLTDYLQFLTGYEKVFVNEHQYNNSIEPLYLVVFKHIESKQSKK